MRPSEFACGKLLEICGKTCGKVYKTVENSVLVSVICVGLSDKGLTKCSVYVIVNLQVFVILCGGLWGNAKKPDSPNLQNFENKRVISNE